MDVRHFEQLRDVCMNMNTITDILNDFPHIGYKAMTSFLRARGLTVRQVALEKQYQRAHSCVLFGLVRLPHNEDKGYIMAMTTLALII